MAETQLPGYAQNAQATQIDRIKETVLDGLKIAGVPES